MKKRLFGVLSILTVVTFAAAPVARGQDVRTSDPGSRDVVETPVAPDDTPVFIHLTRDAAVEAAATAAREALAKPASSPLMTWHGGTILKSSSTFVILWGPKWGTSSFVGDKATGLASFYGGFGNSNYAKTSTEYTGTNGQVGASSAYRGQGTDLSKASGGNRTSPILAEACKYFPGSGLPTDGSAYLAVYTDLPRGHAGYCAWHSWGSCSGVPVTFAFFWALDGDPGCDPGDTGTVHSQGLEALANVSAHELSEAMTDPRGTGWFDASGAENGDKCAWTFAVPFVTFSNNSTWKLQGEWSNAAYNAVHGSPRGCLSGQ